MNGGGKSDGSIVPEKPSNNAGKPAAEGVEERGKWGASGSGSGNGSGNASGNGSAAVVCRAVTSQARPYKPTKAKPFAAALREKQNY